MIYLLSEWLVVGSAAAAVVVVVVVVLYSQSALSLALSRTDLPNVRSRRRMAPLAWLGLCLHRRGLPTIEAAPLPPLNWCSRFLVLSFACCCLSGPKMMNEGPVCALWIVSASSLPHRGEL